MALYSKFSQQNNKKEKLKTDKIVGIVLTVVSAICLLVLTFSFPKPIRNFLTGVFGLSGFAFFSLMLSIGISLIINKRLFRNLNYFIYVISAFVCILTFLHVILTKNALQTSNFSSYISYCYNFSNTVGGVLLSLISYALYSFLKTVGACIVLAILVVVFVGLSVDSYLNGSFTSNAKSRKIKAKIKKQYESSSEDIEVERENKNIPTTLEKTTNNQNNINLNGSDSVINSTTYTSQSDLARRKYILTPPSMDELYHFSNKTEYNTYSNTISNSNLPTRSVRNPFINKETLQKSREFMQSTYPNWQTKTEEKFDNTNVEENSFNNNYEQSTKKFYDFNTNTDENMVNSYNSSYEANTNSFNNYGNTFSSMQNETNNKAQEDFVNYKLEELKNSISLNNSNQNEFANSNSENFEESVQDDEDYGSIHNIETFATQPDSSNLNLEEINNSNLSYSNSINSQHNTISNSQNTYINQFPSQAEPETRQEYVKKIKRHKKYVKPPLDLLTTLSSNYADSDEECQQKVAILEQTLEDFRIPAKVRQVTKGPAVTRYEIQMPAGISVKKVQQHADDIAMTLSANGKIRIEAPIPGKNAVGIEVPNNEVATIGLRDVIDSEAFNKSNSPLTFGLGKNITGESKVGDIRKLTHMLVAGTTGSGKSVCLNSMIISLMYKSSPEDLRFILIDPKRVEFAVFSGMPHLMLPDIISEPEKALNSLNWCIKEMERRYAVIEEARVKNLKEYNETPEVINGEKEKLPLIVVIVDELSDLMLYNKREVEEKILKLAQKSRAAGIHLVLATQRPSVDVITGTIKGNLPSRIAFAVTSYPDSNTILGCGGAERLLGRGDMLYAPQGLPEPERVQGAFISNSEVEAVVDFIKQNNDDYFDEELSKSIVSKPSAKMGSSYEDSNDFDDYFVDALRLVIEQGSASGSFIQRRLGIGYNRAGRIIDQMEREHFIAPSDGSNKPRAVLITMEEFERRFS